VAQQFGTLLAEGSSGTRYGPVRHFRVSRSNLRHHMVFHAIFLTSTVSDWYLVCCACTTYLRPSGFPLS